VLRKTKWEKLIREASLPEWIKAYCTAREAEVIRLKFWDGLNQREIAKRLNISKATVGKSLNRGLEKLIKARDEGKIT